MRSELYKDGKLVKAEDFRTLEGEKARRIAELKTVAGEKIISQFPFYKQINAALGLLSEEQQANIINGIQEVRASIDELEIKITQCTTLAQLDKLNTTTF